MLDLVSWRSVNVSLDVLCTEEIILYGLTIFMLPNRAFLVRLPYGLGLSISQRSLSSVEISLEEKKKLNEKAKDYAKFLRNPC